jgi:hypothetical protein
MSSERAGPPLCPSAPAAPGASLIALVGADARVVHLVTPLTIDADFIASAEQAGSLGKRFRFSSPCQEARCGHWAGHECGLIGRLHQAATETGHADEAAPLPPCTIRGQCRWWAQRGRQACSVCTVVVTDPGLPPA